MRGVYTAEARMNITGAKTVIYLEAPSSAVIEILSASITNLNNDNSEQMAAGLFRINTKGSPAGSGISPYKHEGNDANSNAICLVNLTSEPNTYSSGAIDRQGWNVLGGYRYDPIPEERPTLPPTGCVGLRLLDPPTSGFHIAAQIIYREIG